MNLHDKFRPVALRLLAKFGTAATLTRTGVSVAPTREQKFDKTKRTPRVTTIVTNTTAVVGKPIDIGYDAGVNRFETATVMLDLPIAGDKLALGSRTWTIGHVDILEPQGQPIIYFAEVIL